MRSMAEGWAEPFKEIVQSIPDGTEAKPITLEDWPTPPKGSWVNLNGKATLVGDAAHAMTMCKFNFVGRNGRFSLLLTEPRFA